MYNTHTITDIWAKFKFGTETDDIIDPVEVGCNPTSILFKLNQKKSYWCSLGQKTKGSGDSNQSAHIQ